MVINKAKIRLSKEPTRCEQRIYPDRHCSWRDLARSGGFWGAVFAWAVSFWATPTLAQNQVPLESTNALPTLTQARQILSLPHEQAVRHYPVRLNGVVTLSDTSTSLWFVQDDTAGVYVYQPDIPLQAGQLVELTGETAGGFSPFVRNPKVGQLGRGTTPVPLAVSLEDLSTGSQDSQWVEITGVVRRAVEDWGHLLLEIGNGSSRLKARVFQFPSTAQTNLVDARVRARGVAGTHYNDKRQLTGFHLLVPSIDDVTVVEPPPTNAFQLPIQTGRSLLSYTRGNRSDHRVRVRGTVTLHQPGEWLLIRDDTAGIRVQSEMRTPLAEGDVVDVVGFPTRGAYSPILADAQYRKIASVTPLQAVGINIDQALSGTYDNELVEMEALLLHIGRDAPNGYRLTLQASGKVFRASLSGSGANGSLTSDKEGGRVRLRGVGIVGVDANAKPTSFELWLRSANDLVVLSAPPWWTSARVGWAVGLAFAALLAGSLWTHLLRRQVRQQTEIIRRREAALEERYQDLFENGNDLIYSHDLDGNLVSMNRACERVTGYSEAEAQGMNIYQLIAPAYQTQVQLKTREKIAGLPRTTYEVEMIAKDGRRVFLEVSSRLSYKDGQPAGVIGIARDITERKQAEQALRRSEQQLRNSLDERVRLGRDLHDGIIQSIYAVGLALEDCRRSLQKPPQLVAQQLAQCTGDLNAVIREVRDFIIRLELDESDVRDFPTVLRTLVETMNERQSALRFELRIDPQAVEHLEPRQIHELLHVAREAMSNSLRHSKAERCVLSLSAGQSRLRFEIRDDGVGFDLTNPAYQGRGLLNMAARAKDLAARIEVDSFPGSGTCVRLELPANFGHDFTEG